MTEKTDIDKASTTKGLAKLERLGYVKRVPDDYDRRVRRLYLTAAGENILPAIKRSFRRVTEVCAADLSSEELTELFRLLDKVEHSLSSYIRRRKEG